jgi:hypothetical protein
MTPKIAPSLRAERIPVEQVPSSTSPVPDR